MKTSLTLMFISICLSANAQKSKSTESYSYLFTVQQIIQREALICMSQGLGQTQTMISKYDELKKVNDSLSFISKYNGGAVLKKDSILINQYFKGINTFGQTSSDFLKWSDPSLKIGLYNNSLTFIQSRIFANFELNSFKLDADKRAEYIAKNILIPSLANFLPLLKDEKLKYFVLNAGYRTRDFTEDKPYLGDGEQTSILVDRNTLLKYSNAEISEAELMKASVFYNYNANSKSIRKITL